jgi:hypothetical protein
LRSSPNSASFADHFPTLFTTLLRGRQVRKKQKAKSLFSRFFENLKTADFVFVGTVLTTETALFPSASGEKKY